MASDHSWIKRMYQVSSHVGQAISERLSCLSIAQSAQSSPSTPIPYLLCLSGDLVSFRFGIIVLGALAVLSNWIRLCLEIPE